MPWYIRRATTPSCHTTSVDFRLPLHHRRHAMPRHATPRHATPRHATPRHAMPCHVTSSLPLQPSDCWSTWPRRRHQVNVRTQLVRSTSLAYSLTISRTRHRRRRRRSTGIYNLPHRPPWPTTVNRPSTPPANALARCYYVLQPCSTPCTPTTHVTAILIHHDHYQLCRSPKTPPCAARHFSSPPQAITTSSLPVSSPLPPPSLPSPPATRCTNATYATCRRLGAATGLWARTEYRCGYASCLGERSHPRA